MAETKDNTGPGDSNNNAITECKDYDAKRFGLFHIKMIVISGSGFFTDAYDLFSISLLTKLIGRIYFQDNPFIIGGTVDPGKLPIELDCALSAVALCGTLAGQLLFGRLGDVFGRKSTYGFVLMVMIFCAFAQSMSFGRCPRCVVGTLCMWRFLLGVGVGGDYPLSATIMSEYSSTMSRGAFIGCIFAMQGIGILVAAGVVSSISAIWDNSFHSDQYPTAIPGCKSWSSCPIENQQLYWRQIKNSCPPSMDFIWRVCLAIGAIPALFTMYWRSHMDETPRFRAVETSEAAAGHGKIIPEEITVSSNDLLETTLSRKMPFRTFLRKHGAELAGAALTWGLLDVAFYSQNLFQKDVFLQIGWLPPAKYMYAAQEARMISKCQALIALGSTIPGYWATVFTVDILGRRNIQFMGFLMMTAFMAGLAGSYTHLLNPNNPSNTDLSADQPKMKNGWIAMYAFCFFFANFGPNSTTFIIPAELFPTEWKSTGHGFSAATGKAGAIVGAFGFLYASQPTQGEVTYKYPCTHLADMDSAYPKACGRKNNCPTGRKTASSTAPLGTTCSVCIPHTLAGCYPFGIGVAGALGILAATNFLGMLFTFLVPETRGKTLEELNGTANSPTKVHVQPKTITIVQQAENTTRSPNLVDQRI